MTISPVRASLRGILLEGLNFAGKTTTARHLGALLAARGTAVENRHCYVCDAPSTTELQRLAKNSVGDISGRPFPDPDLLRPFNALKSSQMLVDSALALNSVHERGGNAVLIQDRHWFTQYCSNEYFNPGEGYLSEDWRTSCAPHFTVQVYLTCSPEERKRRGTDRVGDTHGLNSYLRSHLDRLVEYDEFCVSNIAEDPSWIILNTDAHSPEEIAARIMAEFDAQKTDLSTKG